MGRLLCPPIIKLDSASRHTRWHCIQLINLCSNSNTSETPWLGNDTGNNNPGSIILLVLFSLVFFSRLWAYSAGRCRRSATPFRNCPICDNSTIENFAGQSSSYLCVRVCVCLCVFNSWHRPNGHGQDGHGLSRTCLLPSSPCLAPSSGHCGRFHSGPIRPAPPISKKRTQNISRDS